MSIQGPRFKLTRGGVAGAPRGSGIYALWEGDEIIYIGRAHGSTTISEALARHLGKATRPCAPEATHCSWELSPRPATRELEILIEFQERHRRLPRCNEEAG